MQKDLLRYSCQLALPHFTEKSQQLLQNAKVLIVGAGGLGCPSAQYLAAAGVGTVALADFDTISISNLHRQILYTPEEAGQKKAVVACKKLSKQNPSINCIALDLKITSDNVMEIIAPYDLILDGTDNFDTKYLLNDACVLTGKPLIYGAIYQYEGQVAVWNLLNKDGSRSPNYRDLFPEVNAAAVPNCAEGGVIPTLAGLIGCMQANEAIKYITGIGELLSGKLLLFDAATMQSRVIQLAPVTQTHISQLQPTTEVFFVTAAELKRKLNDGVYQLIDVRDGDEREAYHIGGRHIPLPNLDAEIKNIPTDKPIVFYCASGKRSGEAVKKTKDKINVEVFSLQGGLKAWQELL